MQPIVNKGFPPLRSALAGARCAPLNPGGLVCLAQNLDNPVTRPFAFSALAFAGFLALALLQDRLTPAQTASTEYQVKAAFLFHFVQFVDWPPDAFKDPDSPIVYCIVGEDPFQGALDASLNGKMLGSRPFRVRHLQRAQEANGCHVLFLAADDKKSLLAALASVASSPALTVGDTEHFAADGGMIGFCLEDNKVRFEINVRAAEHARLKISARLLALAKTVIGGQKGN